jgi:hypothetical protein
MVREHVDVCEIGDHMKVGDDAREADLVAPVVEADDPGRSANQLLHQLS